MTRLIALVCVIFVGTGVANADQRMCDWMLEQAAITTQLQPQRATEFLRAETALLDPMFDPSLLEQEDAPYAELYPAKTGPAEARMDLKTVGFERLGRNCVRLDGELEVLDTVEGTDKRETIKRRDGAPLKISVFVFDDGQFNNLAEKNSDGARGTNARFSVRQSIVDARSRGADQPKWGLRVSVYITKKSNETLIGTEDYKFKNFIRSPKGAEVVWTAADIGTGGQLIGVLCGGSCAEQAGEKPEFPVFAASAPEPEEADQSAPNFDNQVLVFMEENSGGLRELRRVDVGTELDTQSQLLLEELNDPVGFEEAAGNLARQISDPEKPDFDPERLAFNSYTMRHEIIVERTNPPYLSAVQLDLTASGGTGGLPSCVPQIEVTRDGLAPKTFDLSFYGEREDGKWQAYGTDLDADALLAEPLEGVSVRVIATGGGDDKAALCKILWGGSEKAIIWDGPVNGGAAQNGSYELTPEGALIFHGVELVSTQRPVYLIMFNATGELDDAGFAKTADRFPAWNDVSGWDDLKEALTRVTRSVHAAYAKNSGGIYTVMAQGGSSRAFGVPEALTANRVQNLNLDLHKGALGEDSLSRAIEEIAASENVSPRFVVLGRTGFEVTTDFCEAHLDVDQDLLPDILFLDFLPDKAVGGREEKFGALLDATRTDVIKDQLRAFPAVKCAQDGEAQPTQWKFFPDSKSDINWRPALDHLSKFIFESAL